MSKQNRKAFLDMLINYAAKKAKELGYDKIGINGNYYEGLFWNEEFIKQLKSKRPLPQVIEWYKDNGRNCLRIELDRLRIELDSPYQTSQLTFVCKNEDEDHRIEGSIEFIFSDTFTINICPCETKKAPWHISLMHIYNPAQFKELYAKLSEDMENLLQEINRG